MPDISFLQRGFAVHKDSLKYATNYQTSKLEKALTVFVSVLTLGIGFIPISVYKYLKTQSIKKEFIDIVSKFLDASQDIDKNHSDLIITHNSRDMRYTYDGNHVKIKYLDKTVVIQNKSIYEIRENLKQDIIKNKDKYGSIITNKAIQDPAGNQRTFAIDFLNSVIHIPNLALYPTQALTAACEQILIRKTSPEYIKNELEKNQPTDQFSDIESVEALDKWLQEPLEEQQKIQMSNGMIHRENASSDDIHPIQKLYTELMFPIKSWHQVDSKKTSDIIKSTLLTNADALYDLLDQHTKIASLEGNFNWSEELFQYFNIASDRHTSKLSFLGEFSDRIKPEFEALKNNNKTKKDIIISLLDKVDHTHLETLNENIENIFNHMTLNKDSLLSFFSDKLKGHENNFFKLIHKFFDEYFDNLSVTDKRFLVASIMQKKHLFLSSPEKAFMLFIKAGGPYIQKFGQMINMDELKDHLDPIDREYVKAQLYKIIKNSGGAIQKIDIIESLGAASMGETFLVNLHYKNNSNPEEAVVKIKRPGITARSIREVKFLEKISKEIPGWENTIKELIDQIQRESNFRNELKNIYDFQVFNKGSKLVQAMEVHDIVQSTESCLVLKKAKGVNFLQWTKEKEKDISELENDSIDYSGITDTKVFETKCEETHIKLAAVKKTLEKSLESLYHLVKKDNEFRYFSSGQYHGDMHGGNLTISEEPAQSNSSLSENNLPSEISKATLTILDFGNCGQLTPFQQRCMFVMLFSISVKRDAQLFLKYLNYVIPNNSQLKLSENYNETLDSLNQILDTDSGVPLFELLTACNNKGIEVPGFVFNTGRSMILQFQLFMSVLDLSNKLSDVITTEINTLSCKTDNQFEIDGDDLSDIQTIKNDLKKKLSMLEFQFKEKPDDAKLQKIIALSYQLKNITLLNDIGETYLRYNYTSAFTSAVLDNKFTAFLHLIKDPWSLLKMNTSQKSQNQGDSVASST